MTWIPSRTQRQAVVEAGDDRVYWATWEENHHPEEGWRKDVVTERCEEAGYDDSLNTRDSA